MASASLLFTNGLQRAIINLFQNNVEVEASVRIIACENRNWVDRAVVRRRNKRFRPAAFQPKAKSWRRLRNDRSSAKWCLVCGLEGLPVKAETCRCGSDRLLAYLETQTLNRGAFE